MLRTLILDKIIYFRKLCTAEPDESVGDAVKQLARCLDNFSFGEAAVLAELPAVVEFLNSHLVHTVITRFVSVIS